MKAHNVVKSILALFLAVASVTSCQDKLKTGFAKGEAVRFSIGTDATDTKAVYSGQGTTTIERIDWQEGDLIRIYCEQVSEPSDKFADYAVTSVEASGSNSKAHIKSVGGAGLCWGTGDHTFYGVFPSPEDNGVVTGISISPYTLVEPKSSVTTNIHGATVTANLPAEQAVIGGIQESDGNYVAAPDLKNMLMTAKAGPYSESTGIPKSPEVFLSFIPLTTAIKFTIKNGTGAELALTDVQLISGNGKASADVINGAFRVDLDQTGIASGKEVQPFSGNAFKITYSRDYPLCTSAVSSSINMADRTLNISVGTDEDPLRLAVGKELTFTFFLNPCHDFDDLTFKLVKAGGSWMSTRLGYTDGDGVFFPRHKKSTVTGLLVPEGAQWRVSFDADITPWDDDYGESGDISLDPQSKIIPIMTPWDTGEWKDLLLEYIPEGVLPGLFSVNASKQVYFSKGNLTYNVSSSKWAFYDNQYECASTYDPNLASLFTWGFGPWSTSPDTNSYLTGHTDGETFASGEDWGSTIGDGWRTLTTEEWQYLFSSGSYVNDTRSGLYAYGVKVMGMMNCMILYPDGYDKSKVVQNGDQTSYDTEEEWTAAQQGGVVCLPAAGARSGDSVVDYGTKGYYWSSTAMSPAGGFVAAYDMYFVYTEGEKAVLPSTSGFRMFGGSVRLVINK